MFDKQTAELVSTVAQNMPALSNEQMQALIGKPKRVQEYLVGLIVLANTIIAAAAKLLTRVGELIPLPGTAKFELTEEAFRKEANVGYFWDFLKIFGRQVEENVPAATLASHNLEKDSLDGPITEELGERKITTLWHFFCLLKAQAKGQDGPLLTSGLANIFYMQDRHGKVWAVLCRWFGVVRYWYVDAFSVGLPLRWRAGRRVFSRELS